MTTKEENLELVRNDSQGWSFEVGDIVELARIIALVVEHPDHAAARGDAARSPRTTHRTRLPKPAPDAPPQAADRGYAAAWARRWRERRPAFRQAQARFQLPP